MASMPWEDKVVLVTGGSAGLGKALATAFARQRARVIIVARGFESLQNTAQHLRALGDDVLALPADLTEQAEVDVLFDEVRSRYGRLDALVNCAGRSTRKAVLDTAPAEFRQLLEVNFLAAVRCTRAAAPLLLESRGHVVNIGSLAAKMASRYLGAYPASKFALSAYTQQLRLELGPQGLHVLLVCPGPLARDKVRTYGAEEMPNLPDEARRPGAGAKVKPIDPEWLAERILDACLKRRAELIVPARARLLFVFQAISPRLGDWLLTKMT